MDWSKLPLVASVTEAAVVRGRAEFVLEFSPEVRGWFELTIFEDLLAPSESGTDRYFARATEKGDPSIQATVSGATPEEVAAGCLREAGVSLRRARGR